MLMAAIPSLYCYNNINTENNNNSSSMETQLMEHNEENSKINKENSGEIDLTHKIIPRNVMMPLQLNNVQPVNSFIFNSMQIDPSTYQPSLLMQAMQPPMGCNISPPLFEQKMWMTETQDMCISNAPEGTVPIVSCALAPEEITIGETISPKRQVCRNWARGCCVYGKSCLYIHHRLSVCSDFEKGICPLGLVCPFVHVFYFPKSNFNDGILVLNDVLHPYNNYQENLLGQELYFEFPKKNRHWNLKKNQKIRTPACRDYQCGICLRKAGKCRYDHIYETCYDFLNDRCYREFCYFPHFRKHICRKAQFGDCLNVHCPFIHVVAKEILSEPNEITSVVPKIELVITHEG